MTSIKKLLAALAVSAFLATSAGAYAADANTTTSDMAKPAAEAKADTAAKPAKAAKKHKTTKKHKAKKAAAKKPAAAPAADTTAPATNQ